MASFFGEVVTGSFRYFDDEDEDEQQEVDYRSFSVTSPPTREKKLLIVADGQLSAVYLQLVADKQKIGSLNAIGHKNSEIGTIYRGSDWTAVSCSTELQRGEYTILANTILGLTDPAATVICLTSRHISEFRGAEEERGETVVKSLKTKTFPTIDKIGRLEAPNILTGLSAGILSIAAVKGIPACLLVNYVDILTADSLSLQGFQNLHRLPVASSSSLKPATNLAAALKAVRLAASPSNLYM